MQSETARLLLTKLNTDNHYFTLFEMKGCDVSATEARYELNSLLQAGIVREAGNQGYRIVVDLYTLRQIVLEGEAAKNGSTVPANASELSSIDIINSVWRVQSDSTVSHGRHMEDDEDDWCNEDAEEIHRRRAYLEKRRQELVKRLFVDDVDEDDEDETEEPEADEEDADEGDADEGEADEGDADEPDMDEGDEDELDVRKGVDFWLQPGFSEGGARDFRMRLCALFVHESANAKHALNALRICAFERHVSPQLLCQRMGLVRSAADQVCLWLYLANMLQRDPSCEGQYVIALPEKQFWACYMDAMGDNNPFKKYMRSCAEEDRGQNDAERLQADQSEEPDRTLESAAHDKLLALLRTDLKMTRTKAILKAEGCLCASREIGNDCMIAIYERVVELLNAMSDRAFKRLKDKIQD